jgi:hypothetical protein
MAFDQFASWGFIAVVGVILLNRMMLSLGAYHRFAVVYWSIQALDLVAAAFVAVLGIPGFPPSFHILNYFVAFVFIYHIVDNHTRRVSSRQKRRDWAEERRILRERVEAASKSETDVQKSSHEADSHPHDQPGSR